MNWPLSYSAYRRIRGATPLQAFVNCLAVLALLAGAAYLLTL